MKIQQNKVVTMDYKLVDKDGQLIDSSEGEHISFIHGSGQLIDGLEKALIGKQVGDEFDVVVEPKDGYGDWDPEHQQSVPREQLDELGEVEVGMQIEGEDEEGGNMILTVKEIKEDEVVLDANHPLAGVELHFTIKILEIRDATKEELEHGHVHGHGGVVH